MWAPQVPNVEALKLEIEHMNRCIMSGTTPINDGQAGLRIVKMLEAANESLKHRGGEIHL
jgi:predicted dehydrogenase